MKRPIRWAVAGCLSLGALGAVLFAAIWARPSTTMPPHRQLVTAGVTTWYFQGSALDGGWVSLGVTTRESAHLTLHNALHSRQTGRDFPATIVFLGTWSLVDGALVIRVTGLSSLVCDAPDSPAHLRAAAISLIPSEVRLPVLRWRSDLAWQSQWNGRPLKAWTTWCGRTRWPLGECEPGFETSGEHD